MNLTGKTMIALAVLALVGLAAPAQDVPAVPAQVALERSDTASALAAAPAALAPAPVTSAVRATHAEVASDTNFMDGNRAFEAGNRAYAAGRIEEAIAWYERALAASGPAAGVHFNLGNAYARAGKTGPAVLHYERALAIQPDDADVVANLARVRKDAGLFAEPLPAWERWARLQSLDAWTGWGIAALGFLGLVMFLKGVRPYVRRGRGERAGRSPRNWFPLPLVTVVCCAVVLVAATGVVIQWGDLDRAVVVADDARLFVSPFAAAESAAAVQTGRVVEVVKTHGDFRYVRDRSGRTGWIPDDQVAMIRPEAS